MYTPTHARLPHDGSLSEQQQRQQRQLHEFFAGVDVLASTETSNTPLLDAADQTLEGMLATVGGDARASARAQSGLDGGGWMGSGAGGGMDGYGAGAGAGAGATGEEGTAAVALRKSVYHLRQLRQVCEVTACFCFVVFVKVAWQGEGGG